MKNRSKDSNITKWCRKNESIAVIWLLITRVSVQSILSSLKDIHSILLSTLSKTVKTGNFET